MKTANNYLDMYKRLIDSENSAYWVTAQDFKKAINAARKEAIEECAKRAKWKSVPPRMTNMDGVEVDKQSILSLIDELK